MKKSDWTTSKYLKHQELNGRPVLFVISHVEMVTLQDQAGKSTDKPCIFFQNNEKGIVLNSTNWDSISDFLGDESDLWGGKEIVVYPDPNVRDLKGNKVGGIRMRAPKKKTATPIAAPKPTPLPDDEVNPPYDLDDDIAF